MRIEKGDLLIRSAVDSDAELLTKWWNDGAVMEHAGFPMGLNTTIDKTRAQIEMNKVSLSQRCMIEYQNIPVGEMNYKIEANSATMGIKICEQNYQGRGLGTILLKSLIDFLFTDKETNKTVMITSILLDTNLNNKRAQHVYEKIGFRRVKENINSWMDQLGVWQSSVDYEMTKEKWSNLKCLQ